MAPPSTRDKAFQWELLRALLEWCADDVKRIRTANAALVLLMEGGITLDMLAAGRLSVPTESRFVHELHPHERVRPLHDKYGGIKASVAMPRARWVRDLADYPIDRLAALGIPDADIDALQRGLFEAHGVRLYNSLEEGNTPPGDEWLRIVDPTWPILRSRFMQLAPDQLFVLAREMDYLSPIASVEELTTFDRARLIALVIGSTNPTFAERVADKTEAVLKRFGLALAETPTQ